MMGDIDDIDPVEHGDGRGIAVLFHDLAQFRQHDFVDPGREVKARGERHQFRPKVEPLAVLPNIAQRLQRDQAAPRSCG